MGTLQLLRSVSCLQFTKCVQLQRYELSTLKLIADYFENYFINLSNFFNENKMVSSCLTVLGTDG